MAKMGRPKVDDPREYRVTLRLSSAERKLLEAYAEKHELTKAQVLKRGLEVLYKLEEHL
ncbi:MAG: hypothetical protein ACLR9S_00115 [Lachnospiraceae bacterium]